MNLMLTDQPSPSPALAVASATRRPQRSYVKAPAALALGGRHSLPDHNESIAQPFFANEVEQHGSMLGIEPNTAGRRWSAQARGLIRAVDGVVAIIED